MYFRNHLSIENHIKEFSSSPIRLNVIKRKKSISANQIRNKNPKISENFEQNREINRLINPSVQFVDSGKFSLESSLESSLVYLFPLGPIGGYSNVCKTLKQYNNNQNEKSWTNENSLFSTNHNSPFSTNQPQVQSHVPGPSGLRNSFHETGGHVTENEPMSRLPRLPLANQNHPIREEEMDQSEPSKVFELEIVESPKNQNKNLNQSENMEVNQSEPPVHIKQEISHNDSSPSAQSQVDSENLSFLDIFPSRSAIIEKINEKRKEISENKSIQVRVKIID